EQFTAAEPYLRESLKIRQEKNPNDWALSITRSMLGAALAGQKKFAEAEPLLVGGYEGIKDREADIGPFYQQRMTEALRRLVDLYTAWDKPEQAEKWRGLLPNEKT